MKLHIISPDVPFPPDYGGMVDVFYKIKNLYEAGITIYLHCFAYGREPSQELEQYCEAVFYYKRKMGLSGISLNLPYMLYSRRDKDLLANLVRIDAPIMFEGVHTTYYLDWPELSDRKKIIRNQNLEQEYYRLLAQRVGMGFRKCYYLAESVLLKRKESRLAAADAFFTVAEHDHLFFKKAYPGKYHEYIPSFQPYNAVKATTGCGNYALYHGNLGHPENIEAALYLLEEVCPGMDTPFVFAGRNPHRKIVSLCGQLPNCQLIANPDSAAMEQLVAEAQVHMLPTFQATGLKLKLLHALFNGRHIIVNEAMVAGTGLAGLCHVVEGKEEFRRKIATLMALPFDAALLSAREQVLKERYDNRINAQKIKTFLQQ